MQSQKLTAKETILGVLIANSKPGTYTLHTSDMKRCIDDLGIPWGSPVAEECMIHCKADNQGYMDFSRLVDVLELERQRANEQREQLESAIAIAATSSSVINSPWRGEPSHVNKAAKEKQMKLVQQNRNEIHALFKNFVEMKISYEDILLKIELMGISPTKTFYLFLNKNQDGNISFGTFIKQLTAFDDNQAEDLLTKTAGVCRDQMEKSITEVNSDGNKKLVPLGDIENGLGNQRKRTHWNQKTWTQSQISIGKSNADEPLAKSLGMVSETSFVTVLRSGTIARDNITLTNPRIHNPNCRHQSLGNSKSMRDTLFPEDSNFVTKKTTTFENMRLGVGQTSALTLSSETKIIRENIAVAIRKLNKGEISTADFKERVFNLGLDLSDDIVRDLKTADESSYLNIPRFMRYFDDVLIKNNPNNNVPEEEIFRIQNLLTDLIKLENKTDFVALVVSLFGKDKNNDMLLSLSEFDDALRYIGLSEQTITSGEVRLLFNHFDSDGSGGLDYKEIIDHLVDSIQPSRHKFVKYAFQKCDLKNDGQFSISTLLQYINTEGISWMSSAYTAQEVFSHMVQFFILLARGQNKGADLDATMISLDSFVFYFKCVSATIPDDETFNEGMKMAFYLSDKAPPNFQTVGKAVSCGDIVTWNQEPSEFEQHQAFKDIKSRKIYTAVHNEPARTEIVDVIQGNANVAHVEEEMKRMGLSKVTPNTNLKNYSSYSLLDWNTKKRESEIPSVSVAYSVEQIDSKDADLGGFDAQQKGGVPTGHAFKKYPEDLHYWLACRKKTDASNNQHNSVKPFGTENNYIFSIPKDASLLKKRINTEQLLVEVKESSSDTGALASTHMNKSNPKSLSSVLISSPTSPSKPKSLSDAIGSHNSSSINSNKTISSPRNDSSSSSSGKTKSLKQHFRDQAETK